MSKDNKVTENSCCGTGLVDALAFLFLAGTRKRSPTRIGGQNRPAGKHEDRCQTTRKKLEGAMASLYTAWHIIIK